MTEEQLDGLRCTYCDDPRGAMELIYLGPRGEFGRVAHGLGLPTRGVPSPPGSGQWER